MTLALTGVSCVNAQRILFAYFQKIQQTGLANGQIELDDSSGNFFELWVCQGRPEGAFGRCRGDYGPTFTWTP